MRKIICSLEDWDSILDYYRPNGSSKTWYLKELKSLEIPLMLGRWSIFDENDRLFEPGFLRAAITPRYTNLIEYVPKDILGGSPHLYIINVYNSSFFILNRELGFSCISENYIEDIKLGKSKIVIFNLYEGYSGMDGNIDLEIIEEWRIRAELPINSIYYINGNLLSEDLVKNRNLGYAAKGIHYFEPWNKYNEPIIDFNPKNEKFLYLSYNRTLRYHRVYLMWHLYQKGLIPKGSISFYKFFDREEYTRDSISEEFFDYLQNNVPFTIDSTYDLHYNLACNITPADYENTFISLITESLTDRNTLFFSEKIWKPIMVGHPFLLLGNKHSLKYLKNLGYKTFDKWIDESYDDEDDMIVRSKMIVNELDKFSNYTIEDLKKIREEMKEVCEYNRIKYQEIYLENYGQSGQHKKIKEVLLEVWSEVMSNKNWGGNKLL